MNESSIAGILLDVGAVSLRSEPPFTWASGRLSPIYCDNRLLMAHPDHRRTVAESFAQLIEQRRFDPQIIAGTATAGIPHAAWLAQLLGLPMAYVRGGAKQHGKGNRIEGGDVAGARVVLIEDLISTGGSSISAAEGLVDAGAEVQCVASIFTYGLDVAGERFDAAGIPYASLTSFPALLEEALARGVLTAAEKAVVSEWRRDPGSWSADRGGAA